MEFLFALLCRALFTILIDNKDLQQAYASNRNVVVLAFWRIRNKMAYPNVGFTTFGDLIDGMFHQFVPKLFAYLNVHCCNHTNIVLIKFSSR